MKITSPGKLEMMIMNVLWNYRTCTINDVLNVVSKRKKIAYTTVATILQRLYDKELVVREEEHNHYIYSPRLTKTAFSSRLVKTFLKKLVNNFGDVAIASFAESLETLPKSKKESLLKLLQENK